MSAKKQSNSAITSEILIVADLVAKEKGISKEDILESMEEAILVAVKNKYGADRNLSVNINRKTGEIEILCQLKVVQHVANHFVEIDEDGARRAGFVGNVGDVIYERLPQINFSRIYAKNVRSVMMQKIKTIERARQEEEFCNLVGTIVTGIVKRQDANELILDVNGVDGVLSRSSIIPRENFKNGEHVRVLLHSMNHNIDLPLLRLSRTHPDFLKRLFEHEVPEIYDNIVQIHSVARDPGSKSKIAVYAADPSIDPIGACVGIRGSRVQAIVDELKCEKIDIILWSSDLATFVVNSLPNINVLKVILDDDTNSVDVVVPDDQFSNAIGRGGQNVRLASRLTGCNISIITESEDAKNRAREQEVLIALFMEAIDVDDMVAHLLITEGYTSVESLTDDCVGYLSEIPGFNNEIAVEIQNRAIEYLETKRSELEQYCKDNNINTDVFDCNIKIHVIDKILKFGEIKCLNDIGDLSFSELMDLSDGLINKREAEAIIMDIRRKWFN